MKFKHGDKVKIIEINPVLRLAFGVPYSGILGEWATSHSAYKVFESNVSDKFWYVDRKKLVLDET